MNRKRYGRYNVVNPSSIYHLVRLHPNQGISLRLKNPKDWVYGGKDGDKFCVTVNSDYFIETDRSLKDGNLEICLDQKYDFTGWADYGCVCLGDISILLEKSNADYFCNVCLIMDGKKDSICVINPLANLIVMEADQTVEVVCYAREWDDWRPSKKTVSEDNWKYSCKGCAGLS